MTKRNISDIIGSWKRRDEVPRPVRAALADAGARTRLYGLIQRLSGYQNLTMDQRRERALIMARAALLEEGHELGAHDLSILVALLYARVKEETPFLIAPEPKSW